MKYILLIALFMLSLSINAQKNDTISLNIDAIQEWTSSELIQDNGKSRWTYYVMYKNKSFIVSKQVYKVIDACKQANSKCSLILVDKKRILLN